jgi:hypothetical protein
MLEIPNPLTMLAIMAAIGTLWKIIKSFDEIRLESKDERIMLEIKNKKITLVLRKGESKAASSHLEESNSTHQEDTHTLLEPRHKTSHVRGQTLNGNKKNSQGTLIGRTPKKL